MHTAGMAALAIALASCSIDTNYVPRTPRTLALGMSRGEAGIYKDGVFLKISSTPVALTSCSPGAAAAVGQAASHYSSYQTNITIAMVADVLSAFMPPLVGFGVYFGICASDEQQQSYAHVVDAINHHNDELGCVAR